MTIADTTAASPPGITRTLARRALDFDAESVPADVMEIGKQCLLDWFSVTLAGWRARPVASLEQWLREEPAQGRATLFGSGDRTSMSHAALINGTASHALDFDDAHLPSRVHPSAPLWPAIMALSEHFDRSGRQALAAFAAGVQVQSRLAAVMGESHYKDGWHNTATLGSFGATAAAARLREMDSAQLCVAFGLTATLCGGLRSMFGTSAKPLHAGRAAANGILASGLARHGMDAPENIFECAGGYPALYASETFPDALDPGHDLWEVRRIVFKYHTSCYGTQAPIEAAVGLRAAYGAIGLQDVARVDVLIEPQYLDVCNIPAPRSTSQAKFSISHMVALAMAGRDTADERSICVEALDDAEVLAWRQKIYVAASPDPKRANADIHVRLHDGQQRVQHADASLPQTDLPRQRERLCQKSLALLQSDYASEAILQIQSEILDLDTRDHLGPWAAHLADILAKAKRSPAARPAPSHGEKN